MVNATLNAPAILVMGVSGSGKSTLAGDLAKRIGAVFLEGDDFHSPEEIAKMKAGHPLTDADRWPWLGRINAALKEKMGAGQQVVVACSGLRKAYREMLLADIPGARLVYLKGSQDVIAARMHKRVGHFMPASLLDSQFATLEEPGPEEYPIVVSVNETEADAMRDIEAGLGHA